MFIRRKTFEAVKLENKKFKTRLKSSQIDTIAEV